MIPFHLKKKHCRHGGNQTFLFKFNQEPDINIPILGPRPAGPQFLQSPNSS